MPNVSWNTRVMEDGRRWLVWEGQLRVPLDWDPNSGVFIAVTPPGGLANLPALVRGDDGKSPTWRNITVTELAHDDPTPASADPILISEGVGEAGPVYDLALTLHRGAPGEDGGTVLDPSDYGTPAPGRLLAVDSGSDDFELVVPTYSGMFWPTTVTEAPAGTTGAFNITTIAVGANVIPHAWRPMLMGCSRTTGSGPDVRVNLAARLNGTGGTIVALAEGVATAADRLTLVSGPAPGTIPADITIAANAAANIYLMSEKQGGVDTYGTAGTRFCMVPVRV